MQEDDEELLDNMVPNKGEAIDKNTFCFVKGFT